MEETLLVYGPAILVAALALILLYRQAKKKAKLRELRMEIIPNIGLGQLRFGMSPSEVQAVLGCHQSYEPWMGGNLNDSLLYPGLIIGFNKCDKLDEFTIKEKADVTFLKKPLFGMLENELVQTLGQHSIRSEKYHTGYLLPDLHMELDFDERGRVAWVVFEFGG
jgi:hypothetical protein